MLITYDVILVIFLDDLSDKIKGMHSGVHNIKIDELLDLDLIPPPTQDELGKYLTIVLGSVSPI